jgi:SAM-dependent methyltransferase
MESGSLACRVCGNDSLNRLHMVREAMFGTREAFPYIECSRCGCMQIQEVPADLARHYPAGYYSMNKPAQHPSSFLKMAIKRVRTRYWITNSGHAGKLLARVYKTPGPPWWRGWFEHMNVGLDDPILDVGSGAGDLLFNMSDYGFTDLTGIDPFIDGDSAYGRVQLLKRFHAEMTGNFALVMMHHAYEHMPDPLEAMQSVHRLLRPGGIGLIRIPVMGKHAWCTYGVNWAQLDAPRHLFIHTERSIEVLAERVGLQVEKVVYDSGAFQFWASEQNTAGKRWSSADADNPPGNMQKLVEKADALNRQNDGDQASFFLRRPMK